MAAQINSTWAGPEVGQWNDAINWNPAIVPDNTGADTFSIILDSDAAGLNHIDIGVFQPHMIDGLDCYGSVEIDSWDTGWIYVSIAGPNGLRNYGSLDIDGLDIYANVTNFGDLEASGDSASYVGDLTNKSGAYAYLSGLDIEDGNLHNEADATVKIEHVVDIQNGNFINNGITWVNPSAELWVDGGGIENNGRIRLTNSWIGNSEDDSIEDFANAGQIWGSGMITTEASLLNTGSITASVGNLIIHAADSVSNTGLLENEVGSSLHFRISAASLNNNGQIIINTDGSVTLVSEGPDTPPADCTLNNEPNGQIQLLGGALAAASIVQKQGASLKGFGAITGNVLIEPDALIELTGPTNIIGDLIIDQGATLEISDGTTLVTGHTTNNGTIYMKGGCLIPQGGLTDNGTIISEASDNDLCQKDCDCDNSGGDDDGDDDDDTIPDNCEKCKGIAMLRVVSDHNDLTYWPEEGKDKLKANTIVDDGVNGPVNIHTSCSKPLNIGDGFGPYTVIDLIKIFDCEDGKGKGKGHEKAKGKGHETGKGKGHGDK
jgi:hypothetical protein